MYSIGKLLIGLGLGIAALGLVVTLAERIPGFRLGRLPGDIAVQKNGMGFYFPLTTMLLLSGIVSFVLWAVGRFRK
jgi:hypothetical protein